MILLFVGFSFNPCTMMLLFPIFRGVLSLNSIIPGTDMAFYLLDRLGYVYSIPFEYILF